MKVDGIDPDFPPLTTPWVVDYLMEIGPFVSAGMGPGPIGWRDIAAWQEISGIDLQPWEGRLIRRLSAEYLGMLQDAKKPECPAPYVVKSDAEVEAEAVASKIRNVFGAIAARQRDGG